MAVWPKGRRALGGLLRAAMVAPVVSTVGVSLYFALRGMPDAGWDGVGLFAFFLLIGAPVAVLTGVLPAFGVLGLTFGAVERIGGKSLWSYLAAGIGAAVLHGLCWTVILWAAQRSSANTPGAHEDAFTLICVAGGGLLTAFVWAFGTSDPWAWITHYVSLAAAGLLASLIYIGRTESTSGVRPGAQ